MEASSMLLSSSSSSCRSRTKTIRRKNVRFGPLAIDEYPIVLGDSVPQGGVPIAMDYPAKTRLRTSCFESVDHFEAVRRERRPRIELLLDSKTRVSLLVRSGYSRAEITQATMIASECREQRTASVNDSSEILSTIKKQKKIGGSSKSDDDTTTPTPTPSRYTARALRKLVTSFTARRPTARRTKPRSQRQRAATTA